MLRSITPFCYDNHMDNIIPDQELAQRLKNAAKQVKVGAIYTHYKNKTYKVISLALLEATTEPCVIYQEQHGERLTFVRPLTNWLETVDHHGKTVPRFSKEY